MSKTKRELYEDISKIFVENGIRSSDFAKLTELYRRSEMKGMVPLDEVISEHESQLRFLKEEGEVAAYTYGFIEAHIEYLKQKYRVK